MIGLQRSCNLIAVTYAHLPAFADLKRLNNHMTLLLQWRHVVAASQITGDQIICSTTYFLFGLIQKKSITGPHYWAFGRGIHRWPVDSLPKCPVMWKAFPFYDKITCCTVSPQILFDADGSEDIGWSRNWYCMCVIKELILSMRDKN